jgi:NAD(P)-dependent dehydrogenase (short-subunit alcohol dehydrogenase family)
MMLAHKLVAQTRAALREELEGAPLLRPRTQLRNKGSMTTRGKTILITGSTDGVGRYVAERLAAEGWRVIVHGRDRTRGEEVVDRITRGGGKARFLAADLSSLDEVRSLADAVQRDGDRLDALINNAGIGTSGARRELSADGFELRFAVNYLAGFLLTRLLLPMLEKGKSACVVNVSSAGQQPIDFSDVMLIRGYSGVRAYCQSKLGQILFTIDLAKELAGQNIAVNCLHPATYMDTTMVRLSGVQPISTVEQGGAAILQLVESPALAERSGRYFNGMNESRANPQAYDEDAQRRLRALSFELVGLVDPLAVPDRSGQGDLRR